VGGTDIEAYTSLYSISDVKLVNTILRNRLRKENLTVYREAIDRVRIQDRFAFCYLPSGCEEYLLGIIGDFFLSLTEVDFTVLCARNNDKVSLSLRSEAEQWNAAQIAGELLKGIGFGGGHSEMAGGRVEDFRNFNEEEIFIRTLQILSSSK
ncbi:MAG TPA: DHH family phosphoesterase, partial [Spirochaetia bacterium]|nr:DHH family phosphoesterase [Spirochaetia bacterium]